MQPNPAGPADPPDQPAPARRAARPTLIIVTTALGLMMDGIDLSSVSIANPVIAVEMHTRLSQLQWVTNGYLLAMAVSLITAGKLGDRFGHRRVFLIGMVGFAVSSAMVGVATNVASMIVWRILQGLFGAALMPNALAILRLVFSPDQFKRAIGVWGGLVAMATTFGPVVGGIIVHFLGWRWIFFVNLPVAALVVALTLLMIPGAAREAVTPRRLDAPGVLLLTAALAGLFWGLIASPTRGWSDPAVLFAVGGAAFAAVLFVLRARTTADPLVPLTLFRSLPFSAGVSILVLGGMAIFGAAFYLVFYLQQVLALGPLRTGFVMLSSTAMFIFSAPAGGVLNQRYGARVPLVLGTGLMVVGTIGLLQVGVDSSVHAVWPFLLATGLGMGFTAPTAVEVVLSSAPEEHAGVASGLQHTAGMLGTALGTAVLGVLVTFRVRQTLPGHLADAGAPAQVADALSGSANQIAQAVVPVPEGASSAQAASIVEAGHAAFLDGLHTALLATVCAAAAGLVIALFLRHRAPSSTTPEPASAQPPTARAETTPQAAES